MRNCFDLGGKKTKGGGGHGFPPQPSPHAMVLKEHKTMQAPVLVGSVQSLISYVTFGLCLFVFVCFFFYIKAFAIL